jgi:hypothetical protein
MKKDQAGRDLFGGFNNIRNKVAYSPIKCKKGVKLSVFLIFFIYII